jgi:hypothetical protein
MTYSIHKGQKAVPPEGFEPEIPASEDRRPARPIFWTAQPTGPALWISLVQIITAYCPPLNWGIWLMLYLYSTKR